MITLGLFIMAGAFGSAMGENWRVEERGYWYRALPFLTGAGMVMFTLAYRNLP